MENIYSHSMQTDKAYFNKFKKLRELTEIVNSDNTDYKKAILMRRIFPSFVAFRGAYFKGVKYNKDRVYKYELDKTFDQYNEMIHKIGSTYMYLEDEGYIQIAKDNEKFLIKQSNNIDARKVILDFIDDDNSYDLEEFFKKHKITSDVFESCVNRIKTNCPIIYKDYLNTLEINKKKRLIIPIHNINQIIEGIKTGRTIDDKKFDIFEFYKLCPFKGKNIDNEIRKLSKDFPKILVYKKIKQQYVYRDNERKVCTYADNLYMFAKCFSKDADILKTWMDENNIRNITPINKTSTTSFYANGSTDEDFDFLDSKDMFDIMEENNYPIIYEVYNILKENRIKSNRLIKNK